MASGAATATGELLDASTLTRWTQALTQVSGAAGDDTARIDALRALEQLKCAAEAAQADLAVDFDASMRTRAAEAGVPAERQGRGIAHQVALARRESPHRGQRHLGLAKVLRAELPHTMVAFRAGRVTEWTATVLARETACLDVEHRLEVDREVAGDPDALEAMSTAQVGAAARKLAARLDPGSVARRRAKAERDRRVTLRPAPDTMTYLTGLLPVAQGVAVHKALTEHANSLLATGDDRSRSQIMADTLVERITGQTKAPAVPVSVNLVVSDQTLLARGTSPGHLDGHGPIPADLVRDLVAASLHANHEQATGQDQAVEQDDTVAGSVATGNAAGAQDSDVEAVEQVGTWLRKVYAGPHGGLVAMDSRARLVPEGLARFLRIRDAGTCRTPWCDVPIRHHDHIHPAEHGGPTTAINLQGLCVACNHAKQAPGWTAASSQPPDGRHRVTLTTPTGHTYDSTAPPAPEPGRAETAEPAAPTTEPPRVVTLEIHHGTQLDYAPIA